jgi:hypothetical protein
MFWIKKLVNTCDYIIGALRFDLRIQSVWLPIPLVEMFSFLGITSAKGPPERQSSLTR